jgi:hypothetical protein
MTIAPFYVGQSECSAVTQRFIRKLKERFPD